MIREAVKIELHLNSMKREDGFAPVCHGSPSSTLSKDIGCI
jgi:hypothetical protein